MRVKRFSGIRMELSKFGSPDRVHTCVGIDFFGDSAFPFMRVSSCCQRILNELLQ